MPAKRCCGPFSCGTAASKVLDLMASPGLDLSFDRIARQYAAQRAHPPAVSAQLGAAIAAVAGPAARVLELGVGTGRIALPVVAAGCTIVGVDLALEMLRVAQQHGLDDLVQADVTHLPLGDARFDAVLAVHVLHLVPQWRAALAETRRVLRPGGVLIQGRDWRDPQSCVERLRGKLREVVMQLAPGARPSGAGASVGQTLAELGFAEPQEQIAATWTSRVSPAAVLQGMAQRADAETWALSDELLDAAVAQVRDWAATTWADLQAEQEVAQRFVLTISRRTLS